MLLKDHRGALHIDARRALLTLIALALLSGTSGACLGCQQGSQTTMQSTSSTHSDEAKALGNSPTQPDITAEMACRIASGGRFYCFPPKQAAAARALTLKVFAAEADTGPRIRVASPRAYDHEFWFFLPTSPRQSFCRIVFNEVDGRIRVFDRDRESRAFVASKELRVLICQFLIDIQDNVPQQIEVLKESRGDCCLEAINNIEILGGRAKAAIPQLTALLDAKDPSTRFAAAVAILRLKADNAKALSALRRGLKDDRPEMRQATARAIEKVAGPTLQSVVPTLTDALGDSDTPTIELIASALGRIGPSAKDSIPALVERTRDEHLGVRCEAVIALGKIKTDSKRTVPALSYALQDSDWRVRRDAVLALGWTGPDAKCALPTLVKMLDEKATWIDVVAEAILNIDCGNDAALAALLEGLKDSNEHRVQLAVRVIGKAKERARVAVPRLEDLLKKSGPDLEIVIAEALLRIDPKNDAAAEVYGRKLNSGSLPTDVFESLKSLGSSAKCLTPALARTMREHKQSGVLAAWLLNTIDPGNADAIHVLTDAIAAGGAQAETAAAALVEAGPSAKTAVPALKKALPNAGPTLHRCIVQALDSLLESSRR